MNKELKQTLILLGMGVFIMIFMGLISAQSLTSMGVYKKGEIIRITQVCADATWINITSISNPNSLNVVSNVEMTQDGGEFYYEFNETGLLGRYDIRGVSDGCSKTFATYFEITPTGESLSTGKAVFYIGFLFLLIIILGGCMLLFISFENLLNRVAMIGLGYLVLLAITFIGWNMASDFLTSSPFLISFLRILFFVLITIAFPLLIGGFVWYVLMVLRVKEIQYLMNKGFSFDEAEHRLNKRRRFR